MIKEVISKIKSGIYKITNLINGKFYIGSSKNIKKRFYDHRNELRKNKHTNKYLQNSWNKYSEENFKFEIIEHVEEEKLLEHEQYWLDKLQCYNRNVGYNIANHSDAPMKNKKHNKNSLELISEASKMWHKKNKGTKKYDTYLKNLSNSLMGHKFSEETKQKISESHKGKSTGVNNPFYGRKHTKESKNKMSMTSSKLTEQDVLEILTLLKTGEKLTYIAKIFNSHHSTIMDIQNNDSYKYVDRKKEIIVRQHILKKINILKKYKEIKRLQFNIIDVYKIKILLHKYKIKPVEIAKIYNTHSDKISRIKNEKVLSWVKILNINVDKELRLLKNNISNFKRKKVYCITTNELFNSIMEAGNKYKISRGNITVACKNKQKSAGKHPETGEKLRWMYYEDYIKEQNNLTH